MSSRSGSRTVALTVTPPADAVDANTIGTSTFDETDTEDENDDDIEAHRSYATLSTKIQNTINYNNNIYFNSYTDTDDSVLIFVDNYDEVPNDYSDTAKHIDTINTNNNNNINNHDSSKDSACQQNHNNDNTTTKMMYSDILKSTIPNLSSSSTISTTSTTGTTSTSTSTTMDKTSMNSTIHNAKDSTTTSSNTKTKTKTTTTTTTTPKSVFLTTAASKLSSTFQSVFDTTTTTTAATAATAVATSTGKTVSTLSASPTPGKGDSSSPRKSSTIPPKAAISLLSGSIPVTQSEFSKFKQQYYYYSTSKSSSSNTTTNATTKTITTIFGILLFLPMLLPGSNYILSFLQSNNNNNNDDESNKKKQQKQKVIQSQEQHENSTKQEVNSKSQVPQSIAQQQQLPAVVEEQQQQLQLERSSSSIRNSVRFANPIFEVLDDNIVPAVGRVNRKHTGTNLRIDTNTIDDPTDNTITTNKDDFDFHITIDIDNGSKQQSKLRPSLISTSRIVSTVPEKYDDDDEKDNNFSCNKKQISKSFCICIIITLISIILIVGLTIPLSSQPQRIHSTIENEELEKRDNYHNQQQLQNSTTIVTITNVSDDEKDDRSSSTIASDSNDTEQYVVQCIDNNNIDFLNTNYNCIWLSQIQEVDIIHSICTNDDYITNDGIVSNGRQYIQDLLLVQTDPLLYATTGSANVSTSTLTNTTTSVRSMNDIVNENVMILQNATIIVYLLRYNCKSTCSKIGLHVYDDCYI